MSSRTRNPPDDIALGDATVSLWLPDADEQLATDPRYAIRLANADVWDAARGTNTLGTMTISEEAPVDDVPDARPLEPGW